MEVGGKDATKDFADHSSDAKKILAKYKIGEIVEVTPKALSTRVVPDP